MQGNSKAVANCENPKCAAFEFGKGRHHTDKLKTTKKNTMKQQDIKREHFLPGQMVYADQYI